MATVIHNGEALSQSPLREDALAIAEAGFAAIDIGATVKRKIRIEDGQLHIGEAVYPIAGRRVFFAGIGKCAVRGGRAIEAILGDALTAGIALDVANEETPTPSKLEIYIGTHPLPTEENQRASERVLEFLSGREESDLVIMLISGGGSTLLCVPTPPMTPENESVLFEELTAGGASIQDINTVRKHTSRARGGALAVASSPAEVVSLIVSDVPGDDLASIASGPTIRDSSTCSHAEAVLRKYHIDPSGVVFSETAKDDSYFKRITNMLFLSSKDALLAMEEEAGRRGYMVSLVSAPFSGEARQVGHTVLEKLHAMPPKTALLYAGESTVTLGTSSGTGGRNQELALSTLDDVRPNELILPFASDGHDNTDHAGAIADELSRAHGEHKKLSAAEHLAMHRSYDFFKATGDALLTGQLASNVSDLIVALKN
jgi:glycerate 2-kinase